MNLWHAVLVGLGGMLGCVARYAANVAIGSPGGFPLGIMLINIAGSLAMGLLVGTLARTTPQYQEEIRLFVAVGVFGGFTTFSSFSLDAVVLLERGAIVEALAYIGVSVLASIAALFAGLAFVRWLPA